MINDSNNFMFLINASVYGSLKVLKTTEKSHPDFWKPFYKSRIPSLSQLSSTLYHPMCQREQFSTTWTAQNQEHLISASTSTVSPNPVQLIILQKLSFLISLKCTKANPAPIPKGNKIWLAFIRKEMLTEKQENTVILGRTTSVSLRSEISWAKSGLQDLFQPAVRTLYQTAQLGININTGMTGTVHQRTGGTAHQTLSLICSGLNQPQHPCFKDWLHLLDHIGTMPARNTGHIPCGIFPVTAGYRHYWTLLLPISYGWV